jgi:hypothetical protein
VNLGDPIKSHGIRNKRSVEFDNFKVGRVNGIGMKIFLGAESGMEYVSEIRRRGLNTYHVEVKYLFEGHEGINSIYHGINI